MERNKGQVSKEELLPKAEKLIDLVDYQKNSIVSRTIIDKKTGTVT
ncbi:MAG TPA: cupin domain-containing protein, partial [Desulfotomaculum sp.]|nr:cupin domain-containing protein [Desulfotomaculum sp.]